MKKIISLVMALCMTLSLAVMGIPLHAAEEGNIIINGVDIGYAAGDYFTKNGKTCKDNNNINSRGEPCLSCHKRGGEFDCTRTTDESCNCMRYWPTGEKDTCEVDLLGSQCYGYANYCQWKVYGTFRFETASLFEDLTGVIYKTDLTADVLKEKLIHCSPATHIRSYFPGHSIVIISADENGVTITDNNSSGSCNIRKEDWSWDKLAYELNKRGGIGFAYSYINTWKDQYNPNRNSAITPELIETFLSAYPNGSLTKTATVNGQTVIHTLDTDYDLGFDNYYNYSNNLTQATPLSDKSTAQLLTPAEILYYACVENDMNVVWMLANIQKEQSLVSETLNADPTYDVRLAHAVGYKKNWSEGEKNCGYIGQVISATYQFKLFANDGKNMEEAYNSYTDPNDTSNMRFDKFKPDIYDVYAAKFDALLGTTPPVVEEEYLAYPTITAPVADGTYTAGSAITFSWNTVEGATSYEYGIRDLTDDVILNGADNTTTQTSVTLDGSLVKAGHEIKFAVGALGDEDMTSPGWSSVTVTITSDGTHLAYPTITAPAADGTYTAGSAITFSWNAVEGATSYEYGIRDLTDDITLNGADNTTTQTSVTLDGSLVKADHEIKFAVGALGDEDMTSPGWSSVTVTIADSGDTPTPGTIIAEGTCGDNLTWTLDDAGTLTISGEGYMYNYNPAPWDAYKDTITSLVLPNGLTRIGIRAFQGCTGLTAVSIPDTVTRIKEYAFCGCSNLTTVSIPDGITCIEEMTFYGCSSLTTISIPDGVISIGNSAFSGCSNLTTVSIPDSVTYIGEYAFSDCSSLTTVSIPDNVTHIGGCAFHGCSNLTTVSIPDGITSIRNGVFSDCSSLTKISIPDGVTSIGNNAFSGCSSLTKISIPNGVTSIGGYAFFGCSSLTTVSIPDSVTYIRVGAFFGCSSLTTVSIPDSVTSIENFTFCGCSSLTTVSIPDGVTSIGNGAFNGCSSFTTFSIPDSVSRIGNEIFYGCSSLTTISIPDGVTSIGSGAFSGCSSLTTVSIPDSVTRIENEIFYGCSNLTTISIPDSVTSIGNGAFSGCSSLTTVSIPDSVSNIGSSAFKYCSSLTSVSIPDSVTNIEERAFYGCSSLVSVSISTNNIGERAFYGCSSLVSVYFSDSVTSIGKSAFSQCSSITSLSIPNSVTSIGNYAFYSCSSLATLSISDGVTSIGEYAFSDCSSLTNVSILNSVTSIGSGTFFGCSSLTAISISDSITNIESYTFYGCSSLTSVSIPDSVTTIGGSAFDGCSSLTTISIPDSVTNIGERAFYECSSLTSVSIPGSITLLPSWCFYRCFNLTSVYLYGDAPTIDTYAFNGNPSSPTLYYISGKSGWTSPTWTDSNGVTYNTATFTPGAVDPKPTIPGDISGDGVLDYFDVTTLYAAYQSGEVDTEVMDVNHDGVVDYYDVSKLYAAFRGTATLT